MERGSLTETAPWATMQKWRATGRSRRWRSISPGAGPPSFWSGSGVCLGISPSNLPGLQSVVFALRRAQPPREFTAASGAMRTRSWRRGEAQAGSGRWASRTGSPAARSACLAGRPAQAASASQSENPPTAHRTRLSGAGQACFRCGYACASGASRDAITDRWSSSNWADAAPPREDSRIREKEKNDDRRLSVLPGRGAHLAARFGLGVSQLGSEPWRGTVDASLLLIDEIDCPRVRGSLT